MHRRSRLRSLLSSSHESMIRLVDFGRVVESVLSAEGDLGREVGAVHGVVGVRDGALRSGGEPELQCAHFVDFAGNKLGSSVVLQ